MTEIDDPGKISKVERYVGECPNCSHEHGSANYPFVVGTRIGCSCGVTLEVVNRGPYRAFVVVTSECRHSWIPSDNEAPYGKEKCRHCGKEQPK